MVMLGDPQHQPVLPDTHTHVTNSAVGTAQLVSPGSVFRRNMRHRTITEGLKGRTIPLQAWTGPEDSRRLRLPDFKEIGTCKVVRLSALRTSRLYPPENIPGTHFCQRLSQPQGHSAAGRIMSMKNSNDTIGNPTRDLPACSAVPQPTVLPRAPQ